MTIAMQKWEIAAPGDANLRLVRAPKPWPKPDEILLEVDAVALNYREPWIIDGGMGNAWEPPLTPGSDVAGRVVAVGDQVTRFAVGDRVIDHDIVGWVDGDAPPPDAHSFQVGRLAHYVAAPRGLVQRGAALARRRGGEHAARGGPDCLDGLGRARQAPGRTDGS